MKSSARNAVIARGNTNTPSEKTKRPHDFDQNARLHRPAMPSAGSESPQQPLKKKGVKAFL